MGRRQTKPKGDEETNAPQYLFVPVEDELRRLTTELSAIFDDLLSTKESITRNGIEIKKKISWCKELMVLKVHEEDRNVALTALAWLGVLKNRLFPSSPEEYYARCRRRDDVRRVNAAGVSLSKIFCDSELRRLPLDSPFSLSPGGQYSREYQLREVLERAQADPHLVTVAELNRFWPGIPIDIARDDVLAQKYGHDPLEEPASLRCKEDANSEILIFLEHYLPSEVAEVIRDLSRTRRDVYRATAPFVELLNEFRRSFSAIQIIRIYLVQSNRELSELIAEAHDKLLLVAEAVQQSASPELSHRISIFERGDDLEFALDGRTVLLTATQREALVALALLGNSRAFTVERFAELAPTKKSDAGHNFDNKIVLLKAVLPRLRSKKEVKGYRSLKNIIFVDVPSNERLSQFLYGSLGSDE